MNRDEVICNSPNQKISFLDYSSIWVSFAYILAVVVMCIILGLRYNMMIAFFVGIIFIMLWYIIPAAPKIDESEN